MRGGRRVRRVGCVPNVTVVQQCIRRPSNIRVKLTGGFLQHVLRGNNLYNVPRREDACKRGAASPSRMAATRVAFPSFVVLARPAAYTNVR